ncbi:MAG: hypothetical protein AAF845_02420 [Bacteroidota bacterium]
MTDRDTPADAATPITEKISFTEEVEVSGDGAFPDGAIAVDAPEAESDDSPGHLDQIRSILFGQAQAKTDTRLERIEARIAQEMTQLRDDVARRLDSLESYARTEAEGLARRLDAERRERNEGLDALMKDVSMRSEGFTRRLDAIREEADASDRALRQQVLDEAARAQNALRTRADELVREIEEAAARLGAEKADRHALAALFADAAARLSDGR